MEYIDFTISNKHIVCRRSGVIADNTDYMMRFAFDDSWAAYPDKTVLVLDNDGKIWELHLTGGAAEVKLPKFIGRKLLAVGVTATAGDGEISTDAVSLRVNPSIRTGASEVIESPESGAKDMLEEYRQKYDALIAELQAAIDSTYLGVTSAEVGQTVRITEVDDDGKPTGWEAVDFPEQIQTDYEQTDETAADYLKNRPFGNVAYDGIVFEKVFVFGGYDLVHVPSFDVLANIQGSRQAEIRRGGNVVNTGSASVSVSDRDGSISIKYNSTAGTIIEFKGSNGYLSEINVQSNTDITSVSEYTLHIDGLYYEEYIKLSADKVEGTLPYAEASDYIPVSSGSGKSNYTAKALSSVIPILGVSGASVGQVPVVKAVDENGIPTEWEAADMPEQVQGDWNQNDDTQPDYVKNRPFYTGDPVENVLVEESTVTFEDSDDGGYAAEFPSTFEATVGETYKVSWDGTVYECTCAAVSEIPFPLIGNLSIMGDGSDTGEPFLVGVRTGVGIIILTADTSASHTISISGAVAPVIKIDKKYLPSTIPFMEDGKIPEKYVQKRFPDVTDIFGGRLIGSTTRFSTLANPYPNKTILNALTVEAFNAMLNNRESIPRQVMIDNNLAAVSYSGSTSISVEWSECRMYDQSNKPIAGAWVQAYKANIHEDTDNPGTMVSECAVIRVAVTGLT